MDKRKVILSALLASVVYLVIGYVFYYVIFADFFARNAGSAVGVYRGEMIVWAVFLAQLAMGTLTALACTYAPTPGTIRDGMKIGAWIGLLVGVATAFDGYGVSHVQNLLATVVDATLWIVRASIAGGVASWMLDRGQA
ncbi:MAG: hypothetical protein IH853_12265 [Bacteroidetes bacterium]|nr:hypothetical protein [Bacteroidota bacterium]